MLKVSDFQILIKSCSIESRNDPSPKSEVVHEIKFSLKISYSTHACLAQLDQHQTCNPVMVSVASLNPRNVRFVLFTKTSNGTLVGNSTRFKRGRSNAVDAPIVIGRCYIDRDETYSSNG